RFGSMAPSRRNQVLRLAARYGLVTAPVLHRAVFAECTPKAVERVLTALQRAGDLRSHVLHGRTKYYTLTAAAAKRLGASDKRAGTPFGAQGLIRAYGILCYCLLNEPRRQKFTPEEFAEKFPDYVARGLQQNRYFLESNADGIVRLSLFVVDHGASAR